jgi:hypothetical protein
MRANAGSLRRFAWSPCLERASEGAILGLCLCRQILVSRFQKALPFPMVVLGRTERLAPSSISPAVSAAREGGKCLGDRAKLQ